MLGIDEFWQQYDGQPCELIAGQVVQIPVKEYLHELVTSRIHLYLGIHVETHYLGEVFGIGARFALAADEVRVVDAGFVSNSKLALVSDPALYLPFPPDLMVEVVSARYTSREIQDKVELFLQAGTSLAWVVDAQSKTVTVFDPSGAVYSLAGRDQLSGAAVVAGFSVMVEDLFPPLILAP